MPFQTEEEFFQPLLPMPEITKVTLEYEEDSTPLSTFVNNPHINVGIQGEQTKATGYQDVESFTGRQQAQILRNRSRNLVVKYDLVIKESDVDSPLSVLTSDSIIEALKIKVFIVQNSPSAYTNIADGTTLKPDPVVSRIFEETFDYSDFRSDFVGANKTKKVIETVEGGKKVLSYSRSYKKIFSKNPTSLGIVVYSYFDPDEFVSLQKSSVVSAAVDEVEERSLQSRRDSLLILDGGQISSTKFVFTDLKGNTWNGPIHKVQSLQEQGFSELLTSRELNNRTFLNGIELEVIDKALKHRNVDDIDGEWLGREILEDPRWGGRSVPLIFQRFGKPFDVRQNLQQLRDILQWRADIDIDLLRVDITNRNYEWIAGSGTSTLEIVKSGIWKPLNKTMVSTPKVQDFRVRDEILEIQYDFTSTTNDIFANLQKDLRGDRIDIARTNNYFSDMFLSRDYYDNCRYFFTMNWKQILIDNSLFGKLFDNGGASELLDQSGFNEFRVIRKRFDGSPEIGSKSKPKPFDENEVPEIVVLTKDILELENKLQSVPGNPVDVSKNENSFSEMDADRIQYIDKFTRQYAQDRAIANFTGIDGGIASVTDGYYYYGIEMDIFDGSVEIVRKKLRAILSHIEGLKIYYADAIAAAPRLNAGANETPQYSAYVDVPGETEFEPGEIRLGMNFNTATNRFSRNFIEKYTMSPQYQILLSTLPGEPGTSLRNAITNYIEILKFFSGGNLSVQEIRGLESALLDYLNPNSGTPDSIGVVIKLMETLAEKIESVLGAVPQHKRDISPSATLFTQKTGDQTVRDRSIKIQHDFSSFFNSNLPNKLGFDFLNLAKSAGNGLCSINQNDFGIMIQKERAKIFNDGATPITWNSVSSFPAGKDITTAGTYFTPTTVFLPDYGEGGISFEQGAITENYLKPLSWSLYGRRTSENMIKRLTNTSIGGIDFQSQMVLANDLSSYFSNYHGTAIVTPRNNLERAYNDAAELDTAVSLGSAFNTAMYQETKHGRDMAYDFFLRIIELGEFDQENKRRNPFPNLPVPGGSYDLTNAASSQLIIDLQQKYPFHGNDAGLALFLDNSPPQIKSLMYLQAGSPGQGGTDYIADFVMMANRMSTSATMMANPSLYPEFIFKTQMINQVEVLAGYERSEQGKPLLKKPIWVKMKSSTSDVRIDLGSSSPAVLCRQVPYTNSELKVRRNENFELPTYGEFFLYSPGGTS